MFGFWNDASNGHCPKPKNLSHWKPLHRMEVLFAEYVQSISRIFPYHEKHFHTMELDKTIEIGFSNLFFFYIISRIFPLLFLFFLLFVLHYFQNIFILWKGPIFQHQQGHYFWRNLRAGFLDPKLRGQQKTKLVASNFKTFYWIDEIKNRVGNFWNLAMSECGSLPKFLVFCIQFAKFAKLNSRNRRQVLKNVVTKHLKVLLLSWQKTKIFKTKIQSKTK